MGSTSGSYERAKSLYEEFTKKGNYKGKAFESIEQFNEWKSDKNNAYIYHGPYSRNRNPNAVRGNRQTYVGRTYEGVAGEFTEEEKILIRFNINNAFDEGSINDLIEATNSISEELDNIDEDVLIKGEAICKDALRKYTPIDTGKLMSMWEVWIEDGSIHINNDCEYCDIQNYGSEGQARGWNGTFLWYPGYFMLERAEHETAIAMREILRYKMANFRNEYNDTEV